MTSGPRAGPFLISPTNQGSCSWWLKWKKSYYSTGIKSFHWNKIIPLEWNHSIGIKSFHWNKIILLELSYSNLVPFRVFFQCRIFYNLNSLIQVEWFYFSGMISFQWNDFIPVEWCNSSRIVKNSALRKNPIGNWIWII